MRNRESWDEGLSTLGLVLLGLVLGAMPAETRAQVAANALEAFRKRYAAPLAAWRTHMASFLGLIVKVAIAYITDVVLLKPLGFYLGSRFGILTSVAPLLVSFYLPLPIIVAELCIAGRYQRAAEWEKTFGLRGSARRWLTSGIVVAVAPAACVLALGLMSTLHVATLGWLPVLGRQAVNVVLGLLSFILHLLLVCAGHTPKQLVEAVAAIVGKYWRSRASLRAAAVAALQHQVVEETGAKYLYARNQYLAAFGWAEPYPFPATVVAFLERALPGFSDQLLLMPALVTIEPDDDGDD